MQDVFGDDGLAYDKEHTNYDDTHCCPHCLVSRSYWVSEDDGPQHVTCKECGKEFAAWVKSITENHCESGFLPESSND